MCVLYDYTRTCTVARSSVSHWWTIRPLRFAIRRHGARVLCSHALLESRACVQARQLVSERILCLHLPLYRILSHSVRKQHCGREHFLLAAPRRTAAQRDRGALGGASGWTRTAETLVAFARAAARNDADADLDIISAALHLIGFHSKRLSATRISHCVGGVALVDKSPRRVSWRSRSCCYLVIHRLYQRVRSKWHSGRVGCFRDRTWTSHWPSITWGKRHRFVLHRCSATCRRWEQRSIEQQQRAEAEAEAECECECTSVSSGGREAKAGCGSGRGGGGARRRQYEPVTGARADGSGRRRCCQRARAHRVHLWADALIHRSHQCFPPQESLLPPPTRFLLLTL